MPLYNVDTTSCSEPLRMGYQSAAKRLYGEAVSFYQKGLDESPNDIALLNNLADACLNNGQLDRAESCAKKAVGSAPDEALPEVTLAQILQAQGKHEEAVACVLKAQEKLEELAPELRDIAFDSIEQLVQTLPIKAKFELAGKDWIRIIYLVKSLIETYQLQLQYHEQGVSWEFLHDMRRVSLEGVGARYRHFKQKLGISGEDAVAIGRTVGAMAAITGSMQVGLGQKTATRCTIQIPTCWWHSVLRSMGLDGSPGWIPCSRLCAEHMNCVARAINPAVRFSFSSTLADGAECCEGVFVTVANANPTDDDNALAIARRTNNGKG